ncbi:ABC transporter substrate-binding protein [Azotobacter chroococcum]
MSQHSGGLSRRRFLAGSAGAMAMAPLLGHGLRAEAAAPGRLRVAQYKGGDRLLLEAAGLADTPYPIDWAEFASGNLMVEAMNGGSLDLAYGSEIPPLFGFIKGARIRVVGVIKGDVNEQTVLVPKDSPIRSIADLKGKRVGYVRATTTQYYLTKMLAEVGLSFADIEAINLSVPDGAAAFRAGQLDAWAIYGYSVPLAQTSAGARVLKRANGYLSGNYLFFAAPRPSPMRRATRRSPTSSCACRRPSPGARPIPSATPRCSPRRSACRSRRCSPCCATRAKCAAWCRWTTRRSTASRTWPTPSSRPG